MTANPLRVARGTTTTLATRVLKTGELAYNETTERLHIGDGTTAGGNPVALLSETELSDATLAALAAMDATTGLIEQTGADTFTKRAIGVAASTSVPTRADADGRYARLAADNAFSGAQSVVNTVSSFPAEYDAGRHPVNIFRQTVGNVDAGTNFVIGTEHSMVFGGGKGGRVAEYSFIANTAATDLTSANENFVGHNAVSYTAVGDGGTGLTRATARGAFFPLGTQAFLDNGATNVFANGVEVDNFIAAGASVVYNYGVNAVGCNAVRGTLLDAAYVIGGAAATGNFGPHAGWKHGICFSDFNTANPLTTDSTLIGSYWEGSAPTVAYGVDLDGFTITGYAFRSKATDKSFFGSIDLANTDTSITRASAGRIAVEGSNVLMASDYDTDGTLAANSDTKIATQKAVKTFVTTGYQPLDSDLTAIAALTTTSYGRALLALADAAALRSVAGLILGTDIYSKTAIDAGFQPLDADLTSWAAITRAAGFDTFAATPSSANLRSLLTDESGSGALLFAGGALGTPASGTLTNCSGLPTSGLTGSISVAQMGSSTYCPERITFATAAGAVNFNSANTDTAIAITLPTGFTRYTVAGLRIFGASQTLTTATFGVFTATGAGGTAVVASGTPCTISTASDGSANNAQAPAVATPGNYTFTVATFPTLYFRVQNAQGAAATAGVAISVIPLP